MSLLNRFAPRAASKATAASAEKPSSSPAAPIKWNDGQRAAIEKLSAWRRDPNHLRMAALMGPAGVGKTSVLKALKEIFGRDVTWAAMTGKAAVRMREAAGVFAQTLHSALYMGPRERDNPQMQRVDLHFEDIRPTEPRLLVVDEWSMANASVKRDVLRSKFDKILVVGDSLQIPPVEKQGEEDYSPFDGDDILRVHLTEVMRTAGAIVQAATLIRQGVIPEESMEGGGSEYIFDRREDHDQAVIRAIQLYLEDPKEHCILTWRNDTRALVNSIIRQQLGRGDLPEPGEVMMVCQNVYGEDLMNGDVVEIEEWLKPGPEIAGVPTHFVQVKAAGEISPTTDTGVLADIVRERMEKTRPKVILVPMVGRSTPFDGGRPYVPLSDWRKALSEADVDDVIPLTYAYCVTGHRMQGDQRRRVTTLVPGDLSNPHFRKMTRVAGGEQVMFATRFLYTCVARAVKTSTLIIST